MTGPRDWDKELAEIDRAIERTPAQPTAPAPRSGGGPAALPVPAGGGRTWARLLPVLALAAALP
ncbi:MAG TPA: hypothetical protein VFU46_10395, partial [Gemmatimonadales bacterium]|nr:hypothetical protein [Gemmatimonadales bacterium]